MKRSLPTSILEPAAPPRRKRALSEEERALWDSVARQTRPLRKKPRTAKPATAEPTVAAKPAPPNKPQSAGKISHASTSYQPPPAPPLAPLGRRERSQLSRGRKQIDARLDLHGMTRTRAHAVLSRFLQRAHHDGLTFVLVITGKGRIGAASERGVLRRQVPQW